MLSLCSAVRAYSMRRRNRVTAFRHARSRSLSLDSAPTEASRDVDAEAGRLFLDASALGASPGSLVLLARVWPLPPPFPFRRLASSSACAPNPFSGYGWRRTAPRRAPDRTLARVVRVSESARRSGALPGLLGMLGDRSLFYSQRL